jgi:hypothetical protein
MTSGASIRLIAVQSPHEFFTHRTYGAGRRKALGEVWQLHKNAHRPPPTPAPRPKPKRARRPALFRQKDLERAVKGMQATGQKITSARIDKASSSRAAKLIKRRRKIQTPASGMRY